MYKLHPKLSSMISEKKNSKSSQLVKKVRCLFADVSNKLDKICISSDINELINLRLKWTLPELHRLLAVVQERIPLALVDPTRIIERSAEIKPENRN